MWLFRAVIFSFALPALLFAAFLQGQTTARSDLSSKRALKRAPESGPALDAGAVSAGLYRNHALGFSCKVPPGWVLRTEEMNSRDDESMQEDATKTAIYADKTGQVLLAAFSRPPEARGEDVNSSIVIAAEPISAYPGLKQAAQYFGPLTEVAKAQGFQLVNDPYEFQAGTKSLVRADFQKDVGTRVMHQSTLVMLARGYAVSFTFIGGTEDEIEELVEALSFDRQTPLGRK
jgi:hypothetical protein